MTERPILFSAPMVRALLAGTKTQTRRVVKGQAPRDVVSASVHAGLITWADASGSVHIGGKPCPYGVPGDTLWVRETWGPWRSFCVESDEWEPITHPLGGSWNAERDENGEPRIEYKATSESMGPWKPSIHMPRWASRITLRVTSVRVERVQDITEDDARDDGVCSTVHFDEAVSTAAAMGTGDVCRHAFRLLWVSINGAESWEANPWVWVVGFEVTP